MSVVYCNDIMHEVDIEFWETANGCKIHDGQDITEILSTPHDIWDGDVTDYALCKGYEGKYTATVIAAHGVRWLNVRTWKARGRPGGGNPYPYVRFVWSDHEALEEWYVNRVGIPMGLDEQGAKEELAYILENSK